MAISPLRPNMQFTDSKGSLTKEAFDFLQAIFLRMGGSLANLNAASLENATWESPNPIGATAPNSGAFTALSSKNGFGCNGKTPQTSYTVGGTVVTTAATSTTPFGFTTAAQADSIVTKLNAVITALQNNGIIV